MRARLMQSTPQRQKKCRNAIEHAKAALEPAADTLYNDIYSPEFIARFGGEL